MTDKILIIDDDALILDSYERTLRGTLSIETALGGRQALLKLEAGERFAVILSDLWMPVMDGLELLWLAHDLDPDAVRILLTGNADLRSAIQAVNQGNIYRFLQKPCPAAILTPILTSALGHYKRAMAGKNVLD